MPVLSEGGVSGSIVDQKARFVIDKKRRRTRCRGCDNARPKLFDSWIHALRQFAELHQQSAGVLIGARDQVTVIGVTQPACVLRKLLNDFRENVVASAAGASIVNELCFPEHDPPTIADRFKRHEVHSGRYPLLWIKRVSR